MAGGALREIITLFGLDVDKGSFKSADAKVDKLRQGITTMARAFAGGFVVNELRKIIGETATLGDRVSKTATKIGISTDALQELRYAGELSGVATNTVDMALQRFTRRTAEAAKGTGEAKDALAELGIRLRDDHGRLRTSDDLLGDVAGAMGEVKSGGDRVRLAMRLFDSEGVSFVNMLKDGSANLQAMRDDAHSLGGVLGTELIDLTVEYTDEQTRLKQALRGLKNDLALGLLPGIVATTRATIAWIRENREVISGSLLSGVRFFTTLIESGVRIIWSMVRGLDTLGDSMGSTNRAVVIAVALFAALALVMGLPVAVGLALAAVLEDIYGYFEGRDSLTGRMVEFIDVLRKTPVEPEDWWVVRALKQAIVLFDELKNKPKETARDFADWLGFSLPRFSDKNAAASLESKALAGARDAPLPPRLSGGPEYAQHVSSQITVNQTINAAAGQDPSAVGAAANRGIGDVIAEQNKRAIRSLVPQAVGG